MCLWTATEIEYSLDMAIRTRVKDQSPSGTQRAPVEGPIGPFGTPAKDDRPSE